MKNNQQYVPAFRLAFLTRFYDLFLKYAMPEKRFRSKLLHLVNIEQNQSILDFGCGTGTFAIMMKKITPSATIFGVDVDSKVLNIAARKAVRENAKIAFNTYDGKTLPYADNTFDKVISTLVFHHLTREHKVKALSEVRRVLKNGGALYVADFGKTENALLRAFFFIWRLLDGLETTRDNFTGMLPSLMVEAGFKNVQETREGLTFFGSLYFYCARKIR